VIFVERFSPNFFASEQRGIVRVRPKAAYGFIYPFAAEDLADLAYVFDYEHRDGRDVLGYAGAVEQRAAEWREAHGGSRLVAIDRGDHLLVCDTRPMAREPLTVVDGLARALLLACDGIMGLEQLGGAVGGASREQMEEALEPLVARGFLVRNGDALLSLTLPGTLGSAP
jgi:hypothetical protein